MTSRWKPSPETRALWSKQRRGRKGTPHSAETKAKLSSARRDPDRLSLLEQGLQRCGLCRQIKALEQFYSNTRNFSGRNYRCIACVKASPRSDNYRVRFERELKKKYGISAEDWARAFNRQDGLCAVCHQKLIDDGRNGLHTDHCHRTGRFRGLLCGACNLAAGALKDSPKNALALFLYLQEHSL